MQKIKRSKSTLKAFHKRAVTWEVGVICLWNLAFGLPRFFSIKKNIFLGGGSFYPTPFRVGLNGQSLEIVENFVILMTQYELEKTFDSVRTRIGWSGWYKLKDLVNLLPIRDLRLGTKCRLYCACVHRVILYLYGSDIWAVKEEDVIRLEKMMQGWLDGCPTLGLSIWFLTKIKEFGGMFTR